MYQPRSQLDLLQAQHQVYDENKVLIPQMYCSRCSTALTYTNAWQPCISCTAVPATEQEHGDIKCGCGVGHIRALSDRFRFFLTSVRPTTVHQALYHRTNRNTLVSDPNTYHNCYTSSCPLDETILCGYCWRRHFTTYHPALLTAINVPPPQRVKVYTTVRYDHHLADPDFIGPRLPLWAGRMYRWLIHQRS